MATERVIAYIDGYNLYFGLLDAGLRTSRWLDLQSVCASLLKPGQRLDLVRYFTTSVRDDPGAARRQATFIDALRTTGGIEIDFGVFLSTAVTCRNCNTQWNKSEEKRTDVNIAVRLLNDAYDDRFDMAMIVSGDSDLVPIVESVRERFAHKRVIVASPPKRWSTDLAQSAHAAFQVSRAAIRSNRLPDPVVTPEDVELRAPPRWLPVPAAGQVRPRRCR